MTGRGKLSDAELSKKLGHYQKMSRIWILVGLFGALSGTVSYFACLLYTSPSPRDA